MFENRQQMRLWRIVNQYNYSYTRVRLKQLCGRRTIDVKFYNNNFDRPQTNRMREDRR